MKIIVAAFCLAFFLSGCTELMTPSLFKDRTYTESVSTILVAEDGSKLVFVSDEYHYIFQSPKLLTDIFASPFHRSVRADFRRFNVSRSNAVTGSIDLFIPVDDADAAAAGFECVRWGQEDGCRVSLEMKGTRYAANGVLPVGTHQSLNDSYIVVVSADEGAGAKIVLTPLTLAADGVIVIGTATLMAVGLTILAVASN